MTTKPARRARRLNAPRLPRDPYVVAARRAAMYGLTLAEMQRLLARGVCDACGEPPGALGLTIDHDRSCCPRNGSCGSCVRGVLCSNCNAALGLVHDKVARLAALANYLAKHPIPA